MANLNATFRGTADLNPSKEPTIFNVTTVADTENSQLLPDGTKQLLIRARGSSRTQFSFTALTTATNFITIPKGANYSAELLGLDTKTVFFQTDKADIIEILVWV